RSHAFFVERKLSAAIQAVGHDGLSIATFLIIRNFRCPPQWAAKNCSAFLEHSAGTSLHISCEAFGSVTNSTRGRVRASSVASIFNNSTDWPPLRSRTGSRMVATRSRSRDGNAFREVVRASHSLAFCNKYVRSSGERVAKVGLPAGVVDESSCEPNHSTVTLSAAWVSWRRKAWPASAHMLSMKSRSSGWPAGRSLSQVSSGGSDSTMERTSSGYFAAKNKAV